MSSTRLYPEIADALKFGGSMCLSHLGALHRTSEWQYDIIRELAEVGLHTQMVAPDPAAVSELVATEVEGEVLCIGDLRPLLTISTCAAILQRLRPVLINARQRGWRVLLLTTVPPDLYPPLAGSSILMDAQQIQGRPLDDQLAEAFLRARGITDQTAIDNVCRHAGGSRSLLQTFGSIHVSELSGNAKKAAAERAQRDLAMAVFEEIGPSLCMWLEHWVFESGRDELYDSDIATNFLVALRSAGVLAPGRDDAFSIFPFREPGIWSDVLGTYLESVVEPPHLWPELVSELFAFERELRHALKKALEAAGGLEAALQPHAAKILELARRDSVPAATCLGHVRSPLDWLTLSELLYVAEESARPRLCGYTSDHWQKLSRDLVPIRNRVAHMRLARQGDLDAVRRFRRLWRRVNAMHS